MQVDRTRRCLICPAHTLLSCFGTTLLPAWRLDSPVERARASEPVKHRQIEKQYFHQEMFYTLHHVDHGNKVTDDTRGY